MHCRGSHVVHATPARGSPTSSSVSDRRAPADGVGAQVSHSLLIHGLCLLTLEHKRRQALGIRRRIARAAAAGHKLVRAPGRQES